MRPRQQDGGPSTPQPADTPPDPATADVASRCGGAGVQHGDPGGRGVSSCIPGARFPHHGAHCLPETHSPAQGDAV